MEVHCFGTFMRLTDGNRGLDFLAYLLQTLDVFDIFRVDGFLFGDASCWAALHSNHIVDILVGYTT